MKKFVKTAFTLLVPAIVFTLIKREKGILSDIRIYNLKRRFGK